MISDEGVTYIIVKLYAKLRKLWLGNNYLYKGNNNITDKGLVNMLSYPLQKLTTLSLCMLIILLSK